MECNLRHAITSSAWKFKPARAAIRIRFLNLKNSGINIFTNSKASAQASPGALDSVITFFLFLLLDGTKLFALPG